MFFATVCMWGRSSWARGAARLHRSCLHQTEHQTTAALQQTQLSTTMDI